MILIDDERDGFCWHGQREGGGLRCLNANQAETVRPLVVIDPEDEDQVRLLQRALKSTPSSLSHRISELQAALRSLVAPPKPDEPMGLGAVVEDAEGRRWIRHGSGPAPWMLAGASPSNRDTYPFSGLTAVRVLSEGVA